MYFIVRRGVIKKRTKKREKTKTITIKKTGVKGGGAYKSGHTKKEIGTNKNRRNNNIILAWRRKRKEICVVKDHPSIQQHTLMLLDIQLVFKSSVASY